MAIYKRGSKWRGWSEKKPFPTLAQFLKTAEAQNCERVGTKTGLSAGTKCEALQVIGAKGGTRTPTGFPARS